jgi:hypothetical protein
MEVVVDDARRFRCAATVDLGRGGALLEADEPVHVGDEVTLIPLADTRAPILEIRGTVIRVERGSRPASWRMALALALTPEEAAAIDEIVAAA